MLILVFTCVQLTTQIMSCYIYKSSFYEIIFSQYRFFLKFKTHFKIWKVRQEIFLNKIFLGDSLQMVKKYPSKKNRLTRAWKKHPGTFPDEKRNVTFFIRRQCFWVLFFFKLKFNIFKMENEVLMSGSTSTILLNFVAPVPRSAHCKTDNPILLFYFFLSKDNVLKLEKLTQFF